MLFLHNIFLVADMRRDVQEIYRNTPHGKQVMMFSATLSKEIRPVCKKFMQDVIQTTTSFTTTTKRLNYFYINAPTRIAKYCPLNLTNRKLNTGLLKCS